MPIRVFLVSNFHLLSGALAALIEARPQCFALAGCADSFAQARELIPGAAVDVVLLDIDSGADRVASLVTDLHAASTAKILLLTRVENHAQEDKAILCGARGLIDRDTSVETLLSALQKVHEGQVWLNREATGRIFVEMSRAGGKIPLDTPAAKAASLTEREQEIVTIVARHGGQPGKTIAEKLHISESTLRNHLTSIYDKLGVANRHGLLAYAYRNGLAEQPTQ